MSRRAAREFAFKTIFEIPFHDICDAGDIALYNKNCNDGFSNKSDRDYYDKAVNMCFENIDDIDNKISEHLSGWKIERLSKVNLSILRLALCEILYFDDIPYQVSINEAVEMAKKYGEDGAPNFINGVLASII